MHVIDGLERGADFLMELALRALELRAGADPVRADGARLAAVFAAPSLRTRTSLEAACHALGAHCIPVTPGQDAWSLEWRDGVSMDGEAVEHVADAVRVLAQYADVLAVRAFAGLEDRDVDRRDPVISAVARYSPVPMINMESARWHPLQGMADCATWIDKLGPDLVGQPLTLTWAPHPKALPQAVPNQVLLTAVAMGMDVTLAHPRGFDLDPTVVDRARAVASYAGGRVQLSHDPVASMEGARVVVAKSWAGFSSYGRRRMEADERRKMGAWRVTEERMSHTDGAGFMHCLPVRRNVVVDDAVLDGPKSWVYDEAGFRLWTAMALLERLFETGSVE